MAKYKMKVNYLVKETYMVSTHIYLSQKSVDAWKKAIGKETLPSKINIKDVFIQDPKKRINIKGYGGMYPIPHYADKTILKTVDILWWTSTEEVAKPLEKDVKKILLPLLEEMDALYQSNNHHGTRLTEVQSFFSILGRGESGYYPRYLDPNVYNKIPYDCVEFNILKEKDKIDDDDTTIDGQSCGYMYYDGSFSK